MDALVNRDLLADNACFGCGHHNPHGLQIAVWRDEGDSSVLRGTFTPPEHMAGWPHITHGGAIYTALDCLSTWVATLLGPNRRAAWLLRSAQTRYHRPAPTGEPLTLIGRIKEHGGNWDPLTVRTEARLGDGTVCVEGEFKVVPLSLDRLREVAGTDRIPANWRAFLTAGT
jgi:acyl-CoA thioesterase FadM